MLERSDTLISEKDIKYMRKAEKIAGYSPCVRRKVGCIIVDGDSVIGGGYNRPPEALPFCSEKGCIRERDNIKSGAEVHHCYAEHAEQVAILRALSLKNHVYGDTMYVTASPCAACAKLIVSVVISRVVYKDKYPDELGLEILKESGVKVVEFND